MAAPPDDVRWAHLSTARRGLVVVLLLTPVLAVLAVPVYSRAEPSVAGVPFFYWSQFAAVPLTMLAMAVAALLMRPSGRRRARGVRGRGQQDP